MEFTMIETGWLSLLPPILAIVLALITKEVFTKIATCFGMSLFWRHLPCRRFSGCRSE